jgi:hypothetical protein
MDFVNKHLRLIIAGIALVVIAGIVFSVLNWRNNISNDGYNRERDIVTLQAGMENEISKCLDKGRIAAQVTQKEFDSVKEILINTTAARYVGKDGKSTGATPALGGGAFVSSLHEAYPTIDTSTFKRLMSIVVGCRDDVGDSQDKLQLFSGDFDKWRNTGGLFAKSVRNNFPDDRLHTVNRQTGERLKGEDALEYLTRLITVEEAQNAIKTGTMPGQNLFPTTSPTPAG